MIYRAAEIVSYDLCRWGRENLSASDEVDS
jgi:hypothetical protein